MVERANIQKIGVLGIEHRGICGGGGGKYTEGRGARY